VTGTAPTAAPFDLGVASFDPLEDRILLWTRVDRSGPCSWEVALDADFREVVASGETAPDPETGVVVVDASGLRSGSDHWYRFTAGDASSPVGRTRTLPGGDPDRLQVGVTCCARYGQSPFTVYGALADADVDVVVHLGDYIYEDTKGGCEGRSPEPGHDCVTLEDYRTRHAQARRDPHLQALHARHPMVVVWDDHDLADNAWRGGAKSHDEAQQGPWTERLQAAVRAHHEFLPKRLADAEDFSTAWRRLDAGRLASIVCTETRAQRDEQAGLEGTSDAGDPDRTMLGDDQARWVCEAVADEDAGWVIVVSGTVVSELVIEAPDALDRVLPEKYAIVDGRATNTDQWDGYLAERARLAAALGARSGGGLILSGDIHSSWAIEGPLGRAGIPAAVELVAPPAATTPIGQLLPPGAGELLAQGLMEQLPRVRWVDVDHHGYLTLDIGRERAEASWWWVDPGADAPARLGRRWSVPRVAPMALVDPEPSTGRLPGPTPSPLSAIKRSRRRRRVAAVVLFGALASTAAVRRLRPR
jgi:alkaline phosphatase D